MRRSFSGLVLGALWCGLAAPALLAQEYGLAVSYPRDQGIGNDPAVVFTENFEHAALGDMLARWEYYTHDERMAFSPDVPPLSSGTQSLFMDGSADMYNRLLPGYDELYLRFYARLEASCGNVHHWVWLGGHYPSTGWPWPRAGERPAGDERWSTGVEPMGTNWAWDFYTYWMHMRGNPVPDTYWGNTFSGRPSPWPAEKDRWVCVEMTVKMNNPVGSFNGRQAFWIDGVRKADLGEGFPLGRWVWDGFYPDAAGDPFEGFQWRSAPELNINYVWLEQYVDSDPTCGVRFDDLVIATRYIGPMVESAFRVLRADAASKLPAAPDTVFQAPSLPFVDPDPVLDAGAFPGVLFYQIEPGATRISARKNPPSLLLDSF